jgi:hypothetical protein
MSTSSSPPPSPTEDPETPEEFVRRWVALANQLGRDGKPGPLLAASHQCADCSSIAKGVAKIYADGGWIRGGDWEVLDPIRRINSSGRTTVFRFVMHVAPSTYKPSANAKVMEGTEERVRIQVALLGGSGNFKMHEFVRLAQ